MLETRFSCRQLSMSFKRTLWLSWFIYRRRILKSGKSTVEISCIIRLLESRVWLRNILKSWLLRNLLRNEWLWIFLEVLIFIWLFFGNFCNYKWTRDISLFFGLSWHLRKIFRILTLRHGKSGCESIVFNFTSIILWKLISLWRKILAVIYLIYSVLLLFLGIKKHLRIIRTHDSRIRFTKEEIITIVLVVINAKNFFFLVLIHSFKFYKVKIYRYFAFKAFLIYSY